LFISPFSKFVALKNAIDVTSRFTGDLEKFENTKVEFLFSQKYLNHN